jgi:mycofactocin system glycosyltransferase
VRHDTNRGPGAARNTGLQQVTTPFVALVDDDSSPCCNDLQRLAAQMNDLRVAVVAPRIRSTDNGQLTGEYEQHHSPLDLGQHPTVVRPLARVSYVPATVLVCRTDTAKSLGGFDESMRVGEDVDFVWRAIDAGHLCRYEPAVSCEHETRNTVRKLLKQRFAYGTSAAALAQRHKSAATPLRANIVMLVPTLALLLGYLWLFVLLLPFVYLWYLLTLHRSHLAYTDRVRITTLGLMATIRLTASAVTRVWWPIFFVVGLFVFSPGFALFMSLMIPSFHGLVRHRPKHVAGYIGLRMADSIAYGAGVWAGALRQRSLRCLLPTVTGSALRLRSKG